MASSAAWRTGRIMTTRGAAASGSSRKGSTAGAPGCRTITSLPVDPSGNRTVSTSRLMTRPECTRSVATGATAGLLPRREAVRVEHGHRPEAERLDAGPDLGEGAHHDDGELLRLQV